MSSPSDNRVSDESLNDLVKLSETMVECAREKKWADISALDNQRRTLMDRMSESGHAFDPGKLMLASQELSRLNQELIEQIRLARDHSAQEHKNLRSSRQGIAQYQAEELTA